MFLQNNWRNRTERVTLTRALPILAAAVFSTILFLTLNQSLNQQRNPTILTLSSAGKGENGPIVQVTNGKVKGKVLTSREGRQFYGFYHIPYAEPPVGKLWFQPSKPYKKEWEGILDATERGGVEVGCFQFTGYEIWGKEDCLNLIVFTPKLPSRRNPNPNIPVMVYIYGGIFKFGRANQYGPEYIMDEDVVLVLPDFRTGAFGHLNTEDMEIRGNMAQKDQVLALKWIQQNIARFGGDPKRVLLFGNSSGGCMINGLIISKMARGLFSRAISQSGSVATLKGYNTTPLQGVQQLGEKLNCTDLSDTRSLHKCLIEADPADIAKNYFDIPDLPELTKEFVPANGDLSEVFYEDYPINLLANGSFQKVPWLAGNNNAEGYAGVHDLLKNPWAVYAINNNWNDVAPLFFNFNDTEDHRYSQAMRNVYFGSRTIDNDTRWDLVNLFSDVQWVYPVKSAVDYFVQNGGEAYYYYMTHEPILGNGDPAKPGFKPPYGAAHADEIQYLFPWVNEKNQSFPYIDRQSKDYAVSKNMVKIWTDFARDGRPSAPGVENWPQIDRQRPTATPWMQINDKCRLIDSLRKRMELLDSIPFNMPSY